mmetsp:Transcript_31836/g.101598  ORF Transcript_31836/g.101598 Transcript_31836/m.101598 type:complete len:118 (-) Transcript_31836:740-1093(-)
MLGVRARVKTAPNRPLERITALKLDLSLILCLIGTGVKDGGGGGDDDDDDEEEEEERRRRRGGGGRGGFEGGVDGRRAACSREKGAGQLTHSKPTAPAFDCSSLVKDPAICRSLESV